MERILEQINKNLPYLEELRKILFRSALIFCSIFVAGFFSAGYILKYAVSIMRIEGVIVAASSPFQFADLAVDCGIFLAFLISTPYFVYSFLKFISPGLTVRERRGLLFLLPACVLLYVFGFAYGFYILYFALEILAKLNASMGISNIWDMGKFISQVFLTSSLLGAIFEFPIVLIILNKIGIISVDFLRTKRRIALFTAVVLVALLPPTDGLSLMIMSLPLVALYELTILFLNNKKHVWIRN